MRRLIVSLSLLVLIGGPALGQAGGSLSPPPGSPKGIVPPAPIGHRQPRAGDVPSEKDLSNPNTPVNKEDAVLDKMIKGICRGC
jgi:hypothetical protein